MGCRLQAGGDVRPGADADCKKDRLRRSAPGPHFTRQNSPSTRSWHCLCNAWASIAGGDVPMSSNKGEVPTLVITGAHPRLYNHDLAPVAPAGRTWGVFSLFAMWMSDVHSVGGYTFAASRLLCGLTGWQVLISMTVGIFSVFFLINLIGRPSQRAGVPYPVVARLSFGVAGANL